MRLNEQKQQVLVLLQKAMELELCTIPPYLTALLSIRKEKNRVSSNLIRSVMMEEMLHMVLVGNVVSSLDGTISLGPDNIAKFPLRMEFEGKPFKDRAFSIDLAPFSPESIQVFLQIEMPTSLIPTDLRAQPEIIIPDVTIGAFYQSIIAMLEALCVDFPESEVFCGPPSKQIDEQYYWGGGGKPILVTNLASAKEALQIIIEQGEGADPSVFDKGAHYFDLPDEVAHYFRFNEIAEGRRYRPGDLPSQPPTGEPFEVDYTAVFPIISNPSHIDYEPGSRLFELNRSFNRQYSLMLVQLEQAFNGHPAVLYDAIVNAMHNLTPLAREMMETPVSAEPNAKHGAPSFEWVKLPFP